MNCKSCDNGLRCLPDIPQLTRDGIVQTVNNAVAHTTVTLSKSYGVLGKPNNYVYLAHPSVIVNVIVKVSFVNRVRGVNWISWFMTPPEAAVKSAVFWTL